MKIMVPARHCWSHYKAINWSQSDPVLDSPGIRVPLPRTSSLQNPVPCLLLSRSFAAGLDLSTLSSFFFSLSVSAHNISNYFLRPTVSRAQEVVRYVMG